MKVWTNNYFRGYWPVGSAAVVVANTPEEASSLLNEKLKEMGLEGDAKPEDMDQLKTNKPLVRVLNDGDY